MELNDLTTLLPPGILGLGGVIPILIGQNPFSEDAKAKPLLATVAVLMVWLVWLCCLMLFRFFLFSQYWAIAWVVVAIMCLGVLVYEMIFPKPPPAAETPEEGANRAEKSRRRMALLYTTGVLSTAVAASILVAMKDWVVVDVKFASGVPSQFGEVSLRDSKTNLDVAVKRVHFERGTFQKIVRVVVAQKDFDSEKEWDYLYLESPGSGNGSDKQPFYLERKQMAQIIMPGAGVFFEGVPSNSPSPKTPSSTGSNNSDPQ